LLPTRMDDPARLTLDNTVKHHRRTRSCRTAVSRPCHSFRRTKTRGKARNYHTHRPLFQLPKPATNVQSNAYHRTSQALRHSMKSAQAPDSSPVRRASAPRVPARTTKGRCEGMLTVVDKPRPVCRRQAREAGTNIHFVTGSHNTGVIEDNFDGVFELDETLRRAGKEAEQEILRKDQPTKPAPRVLRGSRRRFGLGHAVWCAREHRGDEPFAVVPRMQWCSIPGVLAPNARARPETRRKVQH